MTKPPSYVWTTRNLFTMYFVGLATGILTAVAYELAKR